MKFLTFFSAFLITTLMTLGVAQAATLAYSAALSGAAESPPNLSTGTGAAQVWVDPSAHFLRVKFDFGGLVGPLTAAHIHGPTATAGAGTAGVMTAVPYFPSLAVGVISGNYDMTFDTSQASTFNPSFVTAQGSLANAEASFFASLASGTAYLNLHSSVYPGGEIRGFLQPAAIPLPATLPLALSGVGALVSIRKRRRHSA
ncbi:MAG: CHRD domain-containing protein [Paracoccaceae bacterium]